MESYGERDPRGQFIAMVADRNNDELLLLGAVIRLLLTVGDADEQQVARAADHAVRRELQRVKSKFLLIP